MRGYRVSTNIEEFDFEVIFEFISNSYWAKGIPKSTLVKGLENSLCFALLTDENQQVGFARMITDKATFAYLADVFVLESHRGLGLSKFMLEHIMSHPDLQGLRRIMLATKDAHGLYKQFGFKPAEDVDALMQIRRPNIYQQQSTSFK